MCLWVWVGGCANVPTSYPCTSELIKCWGPVWATEWGIVFICIRISRWMSSNFIRRELCWTRICFYVIVESDFFHVIKYSSKTYSNFIWVATTHYGLINDFYIRRLFPVLLKMMLWQMLLPNLCSTATSSWLRHSLFLQPGKVSRPSSVTTLNWFLGSTTEAGIPPLAHPKGQGNLVFSVRWGAWSLQRKQNWREEEEISLHYRRERRADWVFSEDSFLVRRDI